MLLGARALHLQSGVRRELWVGGRRSYIFFQERWQRLGSRWGVRLRGSLHTAYLVSWLRYATSPHVRVVGCGSDGDCSLKRAMIQILGYRGRLALSHQIRDRRVRKNLKSGQRYKLHVGYAPHWVRWGQLYRTYRLLWLAGLSGVGFKFLMPDFVFVTWLRGGEKILRLAQNIQLGGPGRDGVEKAEGKAGKA